MSAAADELSRAFYSVDKRLDDLTALVVAQANEIQRLGKLRRDVDWLQRKLDDRKFSPDRAPTSAHVFNARQTVFVRNLRSEHDEKWLRDVFGEQFGDIAKIYLPSCEEGQTVNGTIHFVQEEAAQTCLDVADRLYQEYEFRVHPWQPKKRPRY